MGAAALIGIDWGTTSFRAALMDGTGAILDRIASKDGLLGVGNRDFEGVLERAVAGWDAGRSLPVVASGMVTSRTGWVETPYLPCPAGPVELAAALARIDTSGGRRIAFVTGMSFRHGDGAPDVMRGEETQIAGLGLAGKIEAVPFVKIAGTPVEMGIVHGRHGVDGQPAERDGGEGECELPE